MSRIASFNLYKCLGCGQIHTRPVWGTYRVGSPPNDWGVSAEVLKTCVKCGIKKPIFEYQQVAKTVGGGNSREIVWLVASAAPVLKKQTLLTRLTSAFKQKESLLERYPAFKD